MTQTSQAPQAILSLDLATRTGWAVAVPGPGTGPDFVAGGTVDFREHAHDWGRLDVAFRDWLADRIVVHRPGIVLVEAPVLRGAASLLLCGLAFSAHSTAARHGIPRRVCDSNRVRRWLFGAERLKALKAAPTKNRARTQIKAAVLAWAADAGIAPADDNHADAAAQAFWHAANPPAP